MNPMLLPFLMAGEPALDALPLHLAQLHVLGIEAVEVGVPHSDPIADGPVLQAAAQRAIGRGTTAERVLQRLAHCTPSPDVILFTYLNPLLQLGTDRLLALLQPTPVRALLIVDLPHGEEPALEAALHAAGYPIVPLIAPTTSVERARTLLRERPDPGPAAGFAQRFAYVVARLGITGVGGDPAFDAVQSRVEALRTISARPLAVGFGLGDAETLQRIRAMGAVPVVGSAIVERLAHGQTLPAILQSLGCTAPVGTTAN